MRPATRADALLRVPICAITSLAAIAADTFRRLEPALDGVPAVPRLT